MDINWKKGSQFKKDRIITVTTKKEEWFSIFKLALLVNQIAINELKKIEDKNYPQFLFKLAIMSAIEQAQNGIDWGEEANIDSVKEWCNKYKLKFETVEPELRKNIQKKIEDYDNGTNEMEQRSTGNN